MSDTTLSGALEALRERRRDLELDAVAVRSRIEELAEIIATLEHGPRRRPGRPRVASALNTVPSHGELKQAMNIVPQRVEGGQHEPETTENAA